MSETNNTENIRYSVIRLEPDNFTDNMWGGRWIPRFKKLKRAKPGPIGESWEFSAHRDRPNRVRLRNGETVSLRDLIGRDPEGILGPAVLNRFGGDVPFLLKFIDSREDLSVQVHPPDDYARRVENDSGKAECWFILGTGTKKGEGFIYIGFNPDKRDSYANDDDFKEGFLSAVNQANGLGPTEDPKIRSKAERLILPFLNRVRARAGDVFELPPGTVHAIGRGVRLFEIQQTSDLTYRVWDWNRPDGKTLKTGRLEFRPLHLEKARDVLNFSRQDPAHFRATKQKTGEQPLIQNPDKVFAASLIRLAPEKAWKGTTGSRFQVLTVIKGTARVSREKVPQGHSVLIPAGLGSFDVSAAGSYTEIIRSFVPA